MVKRVPRRLKRKIQRGVLCALIISSFTVVPYLLQNALSPPPPQVLKAAPDPKDAPLLDKPGWTYVLPPIITLLGQGAIAWFAWKQFQKNYEQKNREIDDRDRQFKEAEVSRAAQFKEAEGNRAAQFRSKELQDQFGDIQNRLASPEPIIRANAALRLAQFGETRKPGVEDDEPRTKDDCPYFVPVASQLATALYLEPNPAIRKAIREAIKNLISFANTKEDDQPLLHALIERLADANRTARDNFIRAFAEWTVADEDWQMLQGTEYDDPEHEIWEDGETKAYHLRNNVFGFLASVAPFCREQKTTRLVLETLITFGARKDDEGKPSQGSTFAVQRRKSLQKRKAQKDATEQAKLDALLLPSLETAAQQLIDTRDALAEGLNALTKPKSFTLPFTPNWRREHALNLSYCFLSGSQIWETHLEGANFSSAHLEGAYLTVSHLEGAHLSMAHLEGANILEAHLEGAHLFMAHLEGAALRATHLEGADINEAHLDGADLRRAHLEGARLSGAHMERARLEWAHLEGANLTMVDMKGANLYGIWIQESKTPLLEITRFPRTVLDEAVFQLSDRLRPSPEDDARTKQLLTWLTEQGYQKAAAAPATEQPEPAPSSEPESEAPAPPVPKTRRRSKTTLASIN